jgi:hypothetical protein
MFCKTPIVSKSRHYLEPLAVARSNREKVMVVLLACSILSYHVIEEKRFALGPLNAPLDENFCLPPSPRVGIHLKLKCSCSFSPRLRYGRPNIIAEPSRSADDHTNLRPICMLLLG